MTKPIINMTPEEQAAILKYLKELPKPKPTAMRKDIRDYFETVCLPTLKDNALSELRRTDGISPRLISFMDDGGLGIVDVAAAVGGNWGDARSKNVTARVHRFSARVPGVRLTVFASEVWFLHREGEAVKDFDPKKGIHDHPDRREGVMWNAIHYDPRTGEIMQLMHTIEVIKVLGAHRSRNVWKDTKWGDVTMSIDPMAPTEGGPDRMEGRFIIGPDNDDELKSVKE